MSEAAAKYQDQEIKELLQRTARLEESMKNIDGKLDMVINIRDIAIEANQSTKSAHYRLDQVERNMHTMSQEAGEEGKRADNIEKLLATTIESNGNAHKRLDKLDKIIFWAGTSTIATLIGIIAALFKLFAGGN